MKTLPLVISLMRFAPLMVVHSISAQPYWGPVGIHTSLVGNLFTAYSSDDGQRLYLGGSLDFELSEPGWQNMLVRCTSNGIELIPAPGEIYSVIEFHDTLFIGGSFETSPNDTTPAYNVEYWANDHWDRLGVFDDWGVRSLRVLDDTLYAVGSFTEVDGQPCTGMVRLVNGQWQPLPMLSDQGSVNATVMDIIKFNDSFIAVGTIHVGEEYPRIARLIGNTWETLGPGLEAGFSSIRHMRIYQNDLYVSGQISITENNPGRGIMRWDGSEFHQLGAIGLQRNLGDDTGLGTVGGMVEHNGLLYVGGTFRYAGGQPANGMATWNGTEWCSVPGNLSDGVGYSGVGGAAFLQDTLFVICGLLADGDSVNLAAKFIGESYAGPCESDVSIQEGGATTVSYLFPNPATTNITFSPALITGAQTRVMDALGRVVTLLSGPVTEIDVSAWPRGMYTVLSTNGPATRFLLQ